MSGATHSKRVQRSVVPYDAELLSVTRVPIRAVRGDVTQLDSRLVRQQCTMSGRTATWRQPVHSTFVLTVNDQVGRLTSDLDSRTRARTGYKSLKCGEAPFSSVREQSGPQDCVDTFLPTPV